MAQTAAAGDFVRRFLFENLDIRGAFVRLTGAWQAMAARRDYPYAVARLLGEMTAVTALVAGNLKQPGRLSFQLQGHGPVSLMVIDCTERLGLRGMARHQGVPAAASVPELLGDGRLTLNLHADAAARPYQSVVPLAGASIAAIFEHYLAQSEQQPARLWLHANEQVATGLFLQKLPGADARDADGWNRIETLAATARFEELAGLPVASLLTRLFPEENLRLFDPRPVSHDCPEDWDKVRAMLTSLGRDEVHAILREKGEVLIHDEICNHAYRFSAADIAALFGDEGDGTRH